MKKALFFAGIAILLVCGCVKNNEVASVPAQNEISFITASYLTKAPITGTVFPTTETFSTYAWSAAALGTYFMENVTVAYDNTEDLWKPTETFYWPKDATVDFISYYPTGLTGITVAEDQIQFTGINVNTLQQDIMYADKAAGFSNNEDLVADGANGYSGVPTIFRHALSKVKFIVELTYNHKEEADGTVTDWEVSINSLNVSGIHTTGSCTLNLASTPTSGVIGWDKPAGNVWTSDGTTITVDGAITGAITPGTDYDAVNELYVLPQSLTDGGQKVNLNFTIKTKRNGVDFLSETLTRSADIKTTTIDAWQMNHVYTYRLKISPTKSSGNVSDPSTPVDPNDPDLSDAIITFDPAVDGWQNVGVEATIFL